MLMLTAFFENLLNLFLDTAVWLLFGLLLAAILKGWIPTALIKRWLSGRGIGPVIRAAIIGAPLPLCSCGVLPTAIGLRRSGASKPATVSFLVATPETGVDSISVTYALLGPAMAIIRPLSAIFSAVTSGIMVLLFDRESAHEGSDKKHSPAAQISSEKEQVVSRCCSSNKDEVSGSSCSSKTEPTATTTSACGSGQNTELKQPGILAGLQFAIVDILDDISKWLAAGLVLAAIIATLVEPESLSQWGSGLTGMLLMLVVGLPLYICATASTPLAAALLAAGMSPGAILVFLLVGPATNIASLGILSRELGVRAVIIYLCGISSCAVLLGLTTDAVLTSQSLAVGTAMGYNDSVTFTVLKWISAAILLLLAVKPLRQLFWKNSTAACA
ncbi:SO_0444 family Cu/Zn efflux transporter [uncultured Amphritea sp.]|uniref:SO_0444 family Cu/Zn efflux transporter n=1 Tax=Amphritea sp. TaxID=1872502 RepID=UPI0025E0E605|nr:SO_0444 family Cu/Zn efflux transporter [uncultured Amphritea sp.]